MVFAISKLYGIIAIVVLAVAGYFGLNYVNDLKGQLESAELELASFRESQTMLINAYDEEIEELTKRADSRKVIIKEIVKNGKDEKCLNTRISTATINSVRKQNGGNK